MACSSGELHAIYFLWAHVLYDVSKKCREIPEAKAMAEDTFIDYRNDFRWKVVLSTGLIILVIG